MHILIIAALIHGDKVGRKMGWRGTWDEEANLTFPLIYKLTYVYLDPIVSPSIHSVNPQQRYKESLYKNVSRTMRISM